MFAAVAISAAAVVPVGASAAPAEAPEPASAGTSVTLITGDRVEVRATGGARPEYQVVPAPRDGHPVGFQTRREGNRVHVVPGDVAHLVPDVLDPALFDVTSLVEMGYDDAKADSLPLIVGHPDGVRLADAGPALHAVRELPTIGASAVRLPKAEAAAFGAQLAGRADGRRSALSGMTSIRLDRKVRASELDWNLTDVGAPDAWSSGLSGEGTTVAVVDSGVDAGHPDLVGKVTSEDFTGSGTTADQAGHGTHVASILAGTGAAAGGARKGVAFNAKLLSAKVLDANGEGQASWIIAGMEWATARGARIVNLSLGGRATEGPDPLRDAVDRLSATSGALFVVAAGNRGWGQYTVDTPGVAESALTVGATTRTDEVAWFSSRGPTLGRSGLKPDVVAPGEAITGARAEGTGSEPGPYTTLQGTSQATPHVAGAAALLAQQHPDWTARQLKGALIGTATALPNPGLTAFDQGAGSLDLAKAITAQLLAEPGTLDFGLQKFPQREPVVRTITIHNKDIQPRTVDLNASLRSLPAATPAPAGMLTVSPGTITVPAGGTATTTVTLDPRLGDPGQYDGTLSVTPRGSSAPAVRLPVGLEKEPENYDLTVGVVDRNGTPWAHGAVDVFPITDGLGRFYTINLDQNGRGSTRVPPGPYQVSAQIRTPAGAAGPESLAVAGNPEVVVTAATSVDIDARPAVAATAGVDGVSTRVGQQDLYYSRSGPNGNGFMYSMFKGNAPGDPNVADHLFVQPTKPVTAGRFALTSRWRLLADGLDGRPSLYDLVFADDRVPDRPHHQLTATDVAQLSQRTTTYRTLGKPANAYELRSFESDMVPTPFRTYHGLQVPARRVEAVTASPNVRWTHCVTAYDPPVINLCTPPTAHRPGERVSVNRLMPLRHVPYFGRTDTLLQAESQYGDGVGIGRLDGSPVKQAHLKLYRDGNLIGELPTFSGFFEAEPGNIRYTLEASVQLEPGTYPWSNTSHSRWTFTSLPPGPDGGTTRPDVLVLDYQPQLELDGKAIAGRPLTFDIRPTLLESRGTPTLREFTFEVSADNGTTWRPVPTTVVGQVRRGTVPATSLPPGGALSVRAVAADTAGNRIEQTTTRMFGVR
ncbi:subtilisin family serine protease [Saccharothrix tamanrassetensis]|uniref:Subtilisin family serine protease n=1 Tax=Saccharothrix tamanrassetensis TaxID=1051531 RepID=A0A841CA88_9PSEU|nr:S8 family serine peptidase [Saccharothrix tamanrassetensis]MBB5954319.1 subtilisin family serine protease [Saccharothrix tamanrassetensis]